MRAAAGLALCGAAAALDNGVGVTPPMGWRSWNQFGLNINQTLVEQQYAALADRSRSVGGKPTSLLDLGYGRASIDDGWQLCSSGPGGRGFHNASGYPIVDAAKFPDMAAMGARAQSLGVLPGWYANNCHCADHTGDYSKGDVQATIDFGFYSIKMDRAGLEKNATLFAELLNATGRHVLVENNNAVARRDSAGAVECPMHMFRTSADIRPSYGMVLGNLMSVRHYNENGLTGPGCWAYPDMLAVGVTEPWPPGAKHHCGTPANPCALDLTEMRSHFGAWCVVSAPLVLAMDLRDSAELDRVWPILSNTEAIAVNQQWAGDSGRLHSQSTEQAALLNCEAGSVCSHATWMVWTKTLPPAAGAKPRAAVLLMNNANTSTNVSADLAAVGGLGGCGAGCAVRDIWARADLPAATAVYAQLAPHDSAFFVVTAPSPLPHTPSPAPTCLQQGVQYASSKPGNANLEKSARSAPTGAACQAICAGVAGCTCFTLNLDNGKCWLMTNCTTPTHRRTSVSGPARC